MPPLSPAPWWADAVIYQVYPRSFADADGDGMGDLAGVTSKVPYLAELGVDAIWLSPFYVSPQNDGGYDVADFRDVDPRFGTLADFDALLAAAAERGIRIIVDLVPNHTSSEHAWFKEALASETGSAARARYIFRDGKGEDGSTPPNNWSSIFGGPAWTRTENADGTPGQWYLHLFDTSQPDLNWENPEVWAEFRDILRFWLDRGVAGFRVDVAHGMIKAEGLPDWDAKAGMIEGENDDPNHEGAPYFDQDGVHEVYRDWNAVLSEYDGDRMMVAEAWVPDAERLFAYVRPDEMQQAFNFGFLLAGWDAERMSENIEHTLENSARVGRPATWVLSNHDTVRHSARYGLADPTQYPRGISAEDEQPDGELGLARARAAALIELALPGSAYVWEGDELGLPEHTTLPAEVRQDPSFFRTNGAERGRDGCRVPMPWRADAPGYGFSDAEGPAAPWLPQPEAFAERAADRQVGVEGSVFELYRRAIALRRELGLGSAELSFSSLHDPARGVLSFDVAGVTVVANMGDDDVELEPHEPILASEEQFAGAATLPPNAAVWVRLS
ncbi:glycoside hydrolase family 13 protein [Falsarthrobacter nasiphocae]|uniref:Alpha-glucosidase n=1 Tax=Falsarthrobacter nasiphocae TaxID=189863 RepID=A0AAE4C6C9_9MICC|nr:glycoside hydrolase family 13 protein [Falsarthrobacter nasiphocae]MDR6892448.1 alpha-glucosidase [Falsarthrobacter nasiphocae]